MAQIEEFTQNAKTSEEIEQTLRNISEDTLVKLRSLYKVPDTFSLEDVILLARILRKYGTPKDTFSSCLLQASVVANKIASENTARPADIRVFAELGLPIIEYLARDFGVRLTNMFRLICEEKVTLSDVKNALNQILLREFNHQN